MLIAHSPDKLRPELDKLRYQHGKRAVISLVTTRGDLHDGPVRQAARRRAVAAGTISGVDPVRDRAQLAIAGG